ncbi:MAG: hypothetical protein ILA02_06165 [Clostridia bacterium]|jgi:hypothetical protein|nr:hypothetical protein [Clostridia bacterium]
MKSTGKYEDIINLPHHISKKHPQMTMESRAAQFAPFAALVGYEDAVEETARLTTKRIELNEEEKNILDMKLQMLKEQMHVQIYPEISVMYFVPDLKKEGGKYIKISGTIKKIDEYKQLLILDDKTQIPISEIISIVGDSLIIN